MATTATEIKGVPTPADPPTFTTAVPTWHEGDKVLIHPGFEFVIVSVETRAEDAHGTWTVRWASP